MLIFKGGLDRLLLGWVSIGLFILLAGFLFNNDGSRHATQLYLLLFVPALLLLIKERLALGLWRQWPAYLFFMLAAWVLLVGGLNPGSQEGFRYWLKVVSLLTIYLYAVARLTRLPRHLDWVLLAAFVLAALFAWLTLYYQFGVLERSLDYAVLRRQRLQELGWSGLANLDHPIVAGLYYGVFAVVLTWFFVRWRMTAGRSLPLAVAMLGLLVYVAFTFSRGAWFSLAAGGFVLLLLFSNRRAYGLLGLGLALLLLAAYLLWPEIQLERARGVTGRNFIWSSWLERLHLFWVWGSGAGADFHFTFPQGSPLAGRRFIHAHSLYLQLWYEYGVVGITLFIALLLSLLWKGWQCREQPLARLGIALLVFAMVAMVSDVYAVFHRPSPYWVVFWFPVGILLGIQKPGSAAQATHG